MEGGSVKEMEVGQQVSEAVEESGKRRKRVFREQQTLAIDR